MCTFDSVVLLYQVLWQNAKKSFSCTSVSLARIHWIQWGYVQSVPLYTSGTQHIAAGRDPTGLFLQYKSLGLRPELKKMSMYVTSWPTHSREGLAVEELLMHTEFQKCKPGWAPYLRAHRKRWKPNASARLQSCCEQKRHAGLLNWESTEKIQENTGRKKANPRTFPVGISPLALRQTSGWRLLAQRHVPAGTRHAAGDTWTRDTCYSSAGTRTSKYQLAISKVRQNITIRVLAIRTEMLEHYSKMIFGSKIWPSLRRSTVN